MLKVNIRQNLQAVINIAKKYSDLFGPTRIIDLLEKYRTAEGLYFYLGGIVRILEASSPWGPSTSPADPSTHYH